jgi:hypothetical protein
MPLRSQTISHEFFDDLKLIKEIPASELWKMGYRRCSD